MLCVLALSLGCESSGSSVVVVIDAQPAARSTASGLVVRVFGHDGALRFEDVRPVDLDTAWPLRLPLVPEGDDATRTWVVEATLVDLDARPISSARVRGRYAQGSARESALCLYDECATESCGSTETDCIGAGSCTSCRAGTCVDATAVLETLGSSPRCPPPGCLALGPRETVCGDGMDDDCDGRVDCLDPDCGCDAGTCVASGAESTSAACSDGIDNDCDGLTDCEETSDCVLEEGPENCDNGLDDDCDGETDCFDTGCCAALSCAGLRCGGGGLRCCGGRCTNTWSDRENCGACGLSCAAGRSCDRPSARAGGSLGAAACRCALSSGECSPRLCEEHDGSRFCNCSSDGECPGGAICVIQSGDFHSACTLPGT